MPIFVAIVLLLGVLLLTHLVWWRIALPRRQRAVLMGLFLLGGLALAPGVGLLLFWLGFEPLSIVQWLNVGLAVIAFALAYVVTYSALEADSPTLSLVRYIASFGLSGAREKELREFISSRPFISARLSVLVEEGMVQEREGCFHLAEHPYTLFKLVLLHRERVLGLTHHGG